MSLCVLKKSIVSFAIVVYFTSTPASLFSNSYEPYHESAQRGNELPASETRNLFLEAQQMLHQGNAEKAINLFSDIVAKNVNSSQKVLNDDAEYYLALAYLKAGQPGNALVILRKIKNDKNHLYNDKVTDWFMLRVKIAAWKEK